MDKAKLDNLFEFISANREFNRRLQTRVYKTVLAPHTETKDKLISLLYQLANTQSQPNIDKLANFYKLIHEDINCLNSLADFTHKLSGQRGETYSDLFKALKKQDGWGDKTSALFVKAIFHLHNQEYDSTFKVWNDAPSKLESDDNIMIPVDAVINHIFSEVGLKHPTFEKINNLLASYYQADEIEVWDDLWFWGFITQKGSGKERGLMWNESKYWALEHSSKCPNEIARIKDKASEFINIIVQCRRWNN